MNATTYLPQVECAILVEDGMADTHVIAIPDENDRQHVLRVDKSHVVHEGGKTYLPVGIIHVDSKGRRVLIEFPWEADSGAHRAWVPADRFRELRNAS